MTATHEAELVRLEAMATGGEYSHAPMVTSLHHLASIFRRHWRGERCLELGPAEGILTGHLAAAFPSVTVVEGSASFCAELTSRFPDVTVVNSLFEEYTPPHAFDTVVLGHVLEHVLDPVGLLRRIRGWVAPGGVVLATVPNAHSLHRQAAVLMGLLPTEDSLNETDHRFGHRRVYDMSGLQADVAAAGLTVSTSGGYWLKPVSNAQLAEQWTPDMLDAYLRLGEQYPDTAAEIYVVAEP